MRINLQVNFLILHLLLFPSCFFRQHDEIIHEVKNKDTKQKAVLTLTPADLNVGEVYHVYILNENESVDEGDYGVVFSANQWDNVLPRDTSRISLHWISRDNLRISYHSELRILNQVIRTRDNLITYQEFEK